MSVTLKFMVEGLESSTPMTKECVVKTTWRHKRTVEWVGQKVGWLSTSSTTNSRRDELNFQDLEDVEVFTFDERTSSLLWDECLQWRRSNTKDFLTKQETQRGKGDWRSGWVEVGRLTWKLLWWTHNVEWLSYTYWLLYVFAPYQSTHMVSNTWGLCVLYWKEM